jgi:hypothetical protein
MMCCLPDNVDKTKSCDPVEKSVNGKEIITNDRSKNGDSSRFWKTPEVAILSCPFITDFCGANKVVTLTAGTDSTLKIDKSVDPTIVYCNWIVKSAC